LKEQETKSRLRGYLILDKGGTICNLFSRRDEEKMMLSNSGQYISFLIMFPGILKLFPRHYLSFRSSVRKFMHST
jgi:hypothetical protein